MPKTAAKAKAKAKPATPSTPHSDNNQSRAQPQKSPEKAALSVLPKSILSALPAAADIIKHVQAIEALYPDLSKQITYTAKGGAIALARAFVVLHRLNERMLSEEKAFKPFKALYKQTKELTFPELCEAEGITNVPLAEGFRVGTTVAVRASIKDGQKPDAYAYLRAEYPDIIQEVVNASTLSALAKELGEKNVELPDDLFNVARMNNTTVTKT